MSKIYLTNRSYASTIVLIVESASRKQVKRVEYHCDGDSVSELFADLGIFSKTDIAKSRKRRYRVSVNNHELCLSTDEIYEWWCKQEGNYYFSNRGINECIITSSGKINACEDGLGIETLSLRDFLGLG